MAKKFDNPAAGFLPANTIKQEVVTSQHESAKEEHIEVIKEPVVVAGKETKEKLSKITIEISMEDSMKINRIVDAYKMMDSDAKSKYTKKWFLTKCVEEAVEKTMKDLGISLL